MGRKCFEQALIQRKEDSRRRRKQQITNLDANDDALFGRTATEDGVQELDCLLDCVCELTRAKTIFTRTP